MHRSKQSAISSQRQSQRLKLQKKMQSLQNEMEFIEILAQFWPLPNMSEKTRRLQDRLADINRQYRKFTGLSADIAGSLPFCRSLSIASRAFA